MIIIKRDLDLMRSILFEIEGINSINAFLTLPKLNHLHDDEDLIYYQVLLLEEANMIDAIIEESAEYISIIRLTNKGHDYLDSIRDNSIWVKTKSALSTVGGAVSLKTVEAIATKFLLAHFGL